MEFIVEDFKGREYKVHCIEDCDENKGGLFCMVHRAKNYTDVDGVVFVEFEEEGDTDFCIHPDDCDCGDEMEIERYIQGLFYDENYFYDWLYSKEYLGDDETIVEKAKRILNEYHSLDLDKMAVADALDRLSLVAEKMADTLTDLVYDE